MACDKQKITKHDRFGIFRSLSEMAMSGILKDDNYLYYNMVFLWEWRIKG